MFSSDRLEEQLPAEQQMVPPSAENLLKKQEATAGWMKILSRLDEKKRIVVLLRFFSRYNSYKKMARILGIPVGTVRSRLNNEPPDWFFPVRQNLGAILLEAERPEEAEAIYRKDLQKFPENGWSLFGLYQSLEQQGEMEKAREVRDRFEKAWRYADVELEESRIL